MSDEAIYKKQTFGQKTGFGKSPALLVVDFVNGFTDPEIFGGGNIAEAVTATAPLLAFFRSRKLPVVFTRIVYAADGSDAGIWCEKVPRLRELTETASQSQVVKELAPAPGELIVRKTQASAFFGTPLASILQSRGIDTLVLAGCTTSGCVRATAVDACQTGFRPVVVREAVGDRSAAAHDQSLFDLNAKYADVVGLEEALQYLQNIGHNKAKSAAE
jgi:maleamate amidohydrolase